MNGEIVSRTMLALLTYAIVAMAALDSSSKTYQIVLAGGVWAQLSLVLMAFAATVGLWDVFWNDVYRHRLSTQLTLKSRQMVWMFLAVTYCAYVLVMMKAGLSPVNASVLMVCGLGSCAIAVTDTFARMRAEMEEVSG